MKYDGVIIGAGHNGLVAAAYLAKAGLHVVVLERSDVIGGAAVSERPWAGWTVSTASYVVSLLHPRVVADLDLPAHGYSAYLKNPTSFTATLEGRSLLLSRDKARMLQEIESFSKADVRGYETLDTLLCRYAAELHATFLDDEPHFGALSVQAQAMCLGSAAEFAERYVETPVLAAAIANDGIVGTFQGPRDPGTGYVLAHHYAGQAMGIQGAWGYVRGGMGAISEAVASSARSNGAVIRTGSRVCNIIVRGGKAAAVALDDGTEIEGEAILSNADPKTTFLKLLESKHLPPQFRRRVEQWRCEGPSMKLNLALGTLPSFSCRPGPQGAGLHNATIHVAPDIDYLQRAYQEASAGLPSSEPMLEMFLQTPSEPSLAPRGKHLLSVFAQYFPYRRRDGDWTDSQREAVADNIVRTIGRYAPNVPDAVEARQILTPRDLERKFGLHGGHIFHGELLPGQIFEDRFSVHTPLSGLYLCGSGTHPGGCVSGAPGARGARAVLSDLALAREA